MDTFDVVPERLDSYCQHLDNAFNRPTQRQSLRTYLHGLLLGTERHKTACGLANVEPGRTGSRHRAAQRLQWFLSESTWTPEALNMERLRVMRSLPSTAPSWGAVLIVDETGDRKYGTHTAHVGRQYLGSIGKVDSGVVTVHVAYDTSQAAFPLQWRPYTPSHHFEQLTGDPGFHTKPQLALELIMAVKNDWPFRAVLADSGYGRNEAFVLQLLRQSTPFVLTIPNTSSWWHREGEAGSLQELARRVPRASWQGWVRETAAGRQEHRWVAELQGGIYGPSKPRRLICVTPDPSTLPDDRTEYLISNLRVDELDPQVQHVQTRPALPLDIAQLYARRVHIEQMYREVKQHLGWTHCQARSDLALRRHWSLVSAAYCFLLWERDQQKGREGKAVLDGVLSQDTWVETLRRVRSWLEPLTWVWRCWRAFSGSAPPRVLIRLLRQVSGGQGLSLYTA